VITEIGPRHLAATLLPRLEEAPELPPRVRQALQEARDAGAMLPEDFDEEYSAIELEHRANVISALRKAPDAIDELLGARDAIEPSWAVLAQIIEETTFLQVFRRAYFVQQQLGFSADEYLDAHRRVLKNHRLAAFLDQFHTQADPRKLAEAVQDFDVANIDFAQAQLWLFFPQAIQPQLINRAFAHKAGLANEQGLSARYNSQEIYPGHGRLVDVSPHSPNAMAMALRSGQARPEEEEAWEEFADGSPLVARAFAKTWEARGDVAKTEKFLKLAAEMDPSHVNFRALAAHYQRQGDEEHWLQALDDFLKTPEFGLDHAQIRCEIAKHYAERREWDKALPYADAAAESGAQWALEWARAVNEANQNWIAAEGALVDMITRYGEHPVKWYFFCQRNGKGDIDRARQAAFPAGVEQFARDPQLPSHYAALALWLEEKPQKALEIYRREVQMNPTSFTLMQAATLADQRGDHAGRDGLLAQVVDQPEPLGLQSDERPYRKELVELARRLIADLGAGGKCQLNYDELHVIRDRAPESARCGFNFFLASYLERRGNSDLAIEYWKQCMGSPQWDATTRNAAGFELQKRGVEPGQWKQLLFIKPPSLSGEDLHGPAVPQDNPALALWKQTGVSRVLVIAAAVVLGAWLLIKRRGRGARSPSG
jgi:hypothetical protein